MIGDVLVEPGARAIVAARARGIARDGRLAVVADRRVIERHGGLGLDAPRLVLDGGEAIKTFAVLERVLDFCAEAKLSRSSVIVALGGGTVGDLTGLAASLYKRGTAVLQVPTTLLAQVDASVGGKTAVNLASGKNLAGTFHLPELVVCDPEYLTSLSDAEFASGLGEVIKTAIIDGHDALTALEANAEALRQRDSKALADTITRCVQLKSRIVASDPEEHGPRRALNLGHTFAHAIEYAAGYGTIPHGIAVGVGLVLAARAAAAATDGSRDAAHELLERTTTLLRTFGLPASLGELRETSDAGGHLNEEALLEGLGHDKKGAVGRPEFVLARAPGAVEMGIVLDDSLLSSLLR